MSEISLIGCGGDVGDGFAHGHAARGGGVDDGQRRAFAHGHRFAQVAFKAHGGDGAIGHRHLPWSDHLVAHGHAAHAAVADGDQEGFVGHGRQQQHFLRYILQVHARQVDGREIVGHVDHVALHLRRLAQQDVHRHVDRLVAQFRVDQFQLTLFGGHAHGGEQAAFAFAHGFEQWQAFRRDGQNIAFLRLIAPDFLRRHARFFQRYLAQVENRAALGVVGDFRERVRQAARTHVVDGDDRIVRAHLPAGVDDFLGAAFHFRIAALDGIEVQVGRVAAGGHRRGGAAAHADAHARAAQLHQQAADGDVVLVRVLRRDIADAASDHDRLVVAEHGVFDLLPTFCSYVRK